MSNELATVDLQTGLSETDASSLGIRSKSVDESSLEGNRVTGLIWSNSGVVLAIAVPPATAVADYWFWERWKRVAATASWISEGVIGRSISRSEALRIAGQIIERAERERIQLAEWEAERGIQWEDDE